MNKKLVIITAAVLMTLAGTVGATYAAFQASTSTDKTISTSSLDVELQIEGVNISEDGEVLYEAGDIKDGEIHEKVSAKNVGNKDMYIRVRVNKAWYNESEKIFEVNGKDIASSAIGLSKINEDDWIEGASTNDGEDVFLYYKKAVKAGESTTAFMDAFTLLKNVNGNTNHYTGLTAKMRFDADAVQTTAAAKAMVAEWGVVVKLDTDGTILSVENQ